MIAPSLHHTFAIEHVERGRYSKPPTPVEERICTECPNQQIDDEINFLRQCEKMKTDRDIIFSEIEKQCPNFRMLSKQDKFIYLLSAGGTMVSIVAQLVHKHLP